MLKTCPSYARKVLVCACNNTAAHRWSSRRAGSVLLRSRPVPSHHRHQRFNSTPICSMGLATDISKDSPQSQAQVKMSLDHSQPQIKRAQHSSPQRTIKYQQKRLQSCSLTRCLASLHSRSKNEIMVATTATGGNCHYSGLSILQTRQGCPTCRKGWI